MNFNVNGNPVTEFITREGGTINSSGLVGNFVLPPAHRSRSTKSGPATMNLGQLGDFALDVHNTGTGTAWDVSLRDLLPDGATGGMCDLTPQIVSAQVFLADGVTPVPGKGPLSVERRLHVELQRRTQLPARHHHADRRRDRSGRTSG